MRHRFTNLNVVFGNCNYTEVKRDNCELNDRPASGQRVGGAGAVAADLQPVDD